MMKKLDNVNGDYFYAHTAQSQRDYQHENEFLQQTLKFADSDSDDEKKLLIHRNLLTLFI